MHWLGEPDLITGVLKVKGVQWEITAEWVESLGNLWNIAAFRDGERGSPMWPQEARKENDFLRASRKKFGPTDTLMAGRETRVGLPTYRTINVCCLKPLSMWPCVTAIKDKEFTILPLNPHQLFCPFTHSYSQCVQFRSS